MKIAEELKVKYEIIKFAEERNHNYEVIKEAHWGALIYISHLDRDICVYQIHDSDVAKTFGWLAIAFELEMKEFLDKIPKEVVVNHGLVWPDPPLDHIIGDTNG